MKAAAVPKDKLDAAAKTTVNGPEGGLFADRDWDSVYFDRADKNVRRLRQRIFTASRNGDLSTVRNLQKLMLRSLSNTLGSVQRATKVNAGRRTAGVDGQLALTAPGQADLVLHPAAQQYLAGPSGPAGVHPEEWFGVQASPAG